MIEIPEMQDAAIESFRRNMRGEVPREITASWPISGQAAGQDGHYLMFEVWHDKSGRRFTALVDTYELTDGGTIVRRVIDFGRSSVRLASRPVARYSAKALSDFFDAQFASDELREAMRRVLDAHQERLATAAA